MFNLFKNPFGYFSDSSSSSPSPPPAPSSHSPPSSSSSSSLPSSPSFLNSITSSSHLDSPSLGSHSSAFQSHPSPLPSMSMNSHYKKLPAPSPSSSSSTSSSSSPSPPPPLLTTTVLVSGRNSTLEVDPYDVLAAALVPGALQRNHYATEKKRWYILSVFSFLSAIQTMIWCTYSTVPQFSNEYFFQSDDSQHLLALFLNWGCIIYLPAVFLAAWLLHHKEGVRLCVVLGSALCFLASSTRMLLTFFPSETRHKYSNSFILIAHIAQITNAIAGPLVLVSPSKLSFNWFSDYERATATAIASVSGGIGVGGMYLLGPALVQNTSDINNLLRLTTILSAFPLTLSLLYFPNHPKLFPSATAAQQRNDMLKLHEMEQLSFVKGIGIMIKSFSLLCLTASASILLGVYMGWYATLPTVLLPLPYSQFETGTFTSISRFAAIAGGIMSGRMADNKKLQRKFKTLLIIFLSLSLLCFTLFTLSVPSISFPVAPLPSYYWFCFLTIAGAGFFIGACTPLFYELGAELAHPAPESTAAGLMTLLSNVGGLIVLSISPTIELTKVNAMMAISVSVSIVLVLVMKEHYKRHEAGDTWRAKNEGVAAVLQYYSEVTEEENHEQKRGANVYDRDLGPPLLGTSL